MYINFVELESLMLHGKFQDHRTSGSGEDDFKGFCHIWAWRPAWSCDLDHLYKLWFPLPKEAPHEIFALIGQAVSEKKIFENGGQTDDGRTDAG